MAHFKYIQKIDIQADKLLNYIKEEIEGIDNYPFNETVEDEPVKCLWSVVDSKKSSTSENLTELVLERGVPEESDGTTSLKAHVRLKSYVADGDKLGTYSIQMLEGYGSEEEDLKSEGPEVFFECVDEDAEDNGRRSFHTLHTYLSINNKRIVLVLRADPTVDPLDTRTSLAYIGETDNYAENKDDPVGNFMVTAGRVSDEPTLTSLKEKGQYFGMNTSPGNNTFQFLRTATGVQYQQYRAAIITPAPPTGKAFRHPSLGDTGFKMEKWGFQASKFTKKYHLSPIYTVHFYDGHRSMLNDCLAVMKHNVLHEDRFTVEVDKCLFPEKKHDREIYKYFEIDTENNFFNTSANSATAVAVLTEIQYGDIVEI